MNKIYQGDALEILKTLPDGIINTCVTSPPYYGLRDYGVNGQIGLEETPEEYIERLVEVFREVKRVLRDDGTLWVNIGDTYCSTAPGTMGDNLHIKEALEATKRARKTMRPKLPEGMKPKDLMGIPWMLAVALRADGWYLRQDIIWVKPNPMPESVTDRCTKSHEYIFLLSKSRNYYFDAEAIKEPCVGFNNDPVAGSIGAFGPPQTRRRKGNARTFRGGGAYTRWKSFGNSIPAERESHGNVSNETGLRNKRSVWNVATTGSKEAHFATFPPDLIKPCIIAGSPAGGIVLDPFMGSGTTGMVARQNGRHYIGIELNADYIEMAENRIFEATRQQSIFSMGL